MTQIWNLPSSELSKNAGRVSKQPGGRARRLKPHKRNVWHTALDAADFVSTRDRRDYWTHNDAPARR